MTNAARLLAPLLLLGPAACARDTADFPSLAARPAEQRGFGEPQAPPPTPVAADPALDARVTALRTQLAGIVAGFDRASGTARTAAAKPGARTVGSDAWLDAQTAVAQLDDWRAQASSLATDTDALAAARAAVLAPPYASVEALRAAAAAEVARQDAAITALAASLPAA